MPGMRVGMVGWLVAGIGSAAVDAGGLQDGVATDTASHERGA